MRRVLSKNAMIVKKEDNTILVYLYKIVEEGLSWINYKQKLKKNQTFGSIKLEDLERVI